MKRGKTYKRIRFIKLHFSGASKVALTWDMNTKRRLIHVKCDSDVFAQEFSRRVSRDGMKISNSFTTEYTVDENSEESVNFPQ